MIPSPVVVGPSSLKVVYPTICAPAGAAGPSHGASHAHSATTAATMIEILSIASVDLTAAAAHALIQVYLKEQSPDIAAGVGHSLESRQGEQQGGDPFELQGAGDQGMMIGFACNETPELMPLTISLAHRLARQLAKVRKNGTLPFLLPDGKTQVTVEYERGRPKRIEAVVVSTHHTHDVTQKQIAEGVGAEVIDPVLKGYTRDARTKLLVNPSGMFVVGGPAADAGLTGRKIIVDTYGGVARHGGGAFSGKDP